MTMALKTLRAIATCSAAVAISSGVNLPCSTGTRVYALTVWSGDWLDAMLMRCTGGSEEHALPSEFHDYPGGNEDEDVCAGAGGVQSIEWGVPDGHFIMVYLNITCLDNEVYHFANGRSYDLWNLTSNHTVSCEEGQYVQGRTYSSVYVQDNSIAPYFLTSLGFMCSSSTLEPLIPRGKRTNPDPLCTDCSGDGRLKADEDLPEFCELSSCTQAECCELTEPEDITGNIGMGVITTVIAATILGGVRWAYRKYKISKQCDWENVESDMDETNECPENES